MYTPPLNKRCWLFLRHLQANEVLRHSTGQCVRDRVYIINRWCHNFPCVGHTKINGLLDRVGDSTDRRILLTLREGQRQATEGAHGGIRDRWVFAFNRKIEQVADAVVVVGSGQKFYQKLNGQDSVKIYIAVDKPSRLLKRLFLHLSSLHRIKCTPLLD